jgi:hypothetical protein
MTEHPKTGFAFHVGLVSLIVPVLGPVVWGAANRALVDVQRDPSRFGLTSRLVWGRRFGIASTVLLGAILCLGLFGGQPISAP